EHGAAVPVWHALAAGGTLQDLAERVGAGTARFTVPAGSTPTGPAASSWWPRTATRRADRGST
ncbi:MAG: Lysine 2,3-aminomutase, partial [Blastococcus sp.]|nr:Lysine 2,3-aminomutase [Blastococcus sp.]